MKAFAHETGARVGDMLRVLREAGDRDGTIGKLERKVVFKDSRDHGLGCYMRIVKRELPSTNFGDCVRSALGGINNAFGGEMFVNGELFMKDEDFI